MGTLTASDERLPSYCEHKLPSSCRLSSIPNCCACADLRAHTQSYSIYIDGIGYVSRGTRWQRYCWFCKVFWENRVSVSGMSPSRTRIPEIPDQGPFLTRWYEFHRGYRIIQKEDGTEERIAVLGEDLGDVQPGHLPRTLEEMRAGRERSLLDTEVRTETDGVSIALDDGPSLDDALDQLLNEDEEVENTSTDISDMPALVSNEPGSGLVTEEVFPINPPSASVFNRTQEYRMRRVAGLRRELDRMRSGIERVVIGLRDLGEDVLDEAAATSPVTTLSRSLDAIAATPRTRDTGDSATSRSQTTSAELVPPVPAQTQQELVARIHTARDQLNEAQRVRAQLAEDFRLAEQEYESSQTRLRQLQRDQRTMQNYTSVFGTREEMVAQGENYESPIGAMFSRAYDRFRVAEGLRREERTLRQVLEDEAIVDHSQELRRLAVIRELQSNLLRPVRRPPTSEGDDIAAPRANQDLVQMHRDRTHRQMRPPDQTAIDSRTIYRDEASQLLRFLHDTESTDSVIISSLERMLSSDNLTDEDENEINEIVDHNPISFMSGVTAGRFARLRRMGLTVTFYTELLVSIGQSSRPPDPHGRDLELMAESLQMSLELRNRATVVAYMTGEEYDQLSQRMATDRRSQRDYEIVEALVSDTETRSLAVRVHSERMRGPSIETLERQSELERDRQAALRLGEHSRQGLDVRRRETQAFAIAAGRTAMQTGPAALLEQLANQNEGTRAAFRRLEENGFLSDRTSRQQVRNSRDQLRYGNGPSRFESSDSEIIMESGSDSDLDDGGQGLDARNTGRPEPKDEDDMMVRMDCRICFTQVADIACLPCGHLVMCQWCSDQHSPVNTQDRTRPRHAATCPVCRKGIKQKVRVFRA